VVEIYTVGYEGRSLSEFVRLLRDNGITRLVDVRERPVSRKRGFSALPLFDALRKVGIAYESDRTLGNPVEIRSLWKDGDLREGRTRYRRLIRNGRRGRVELLLAVARFDRVCILCFESDPEACHRSVITEEAARLEPDLLVHHL
jgi:uncharacterized protein (DUF488 family)